MPLLVSDKLYKIIQFSVDSVNFLGAIPFRWDKEKNLVVFADGHFSDNFNKRSRWWSIKAWDIWKYWYILYQIFLFCGFPRLIITQERAYRRYSSQVLIFTAFSVACGIQISIMAMNRRLLLYFNQCLTFYKRIEARFTRAGMVVPPWQAQCEFTMKLLLWGSFPAALASLQIFLKHPQWYLFPTSLIPASIYSKWMTYLFALPWFVLVYTSWTCIIVFVEFLMLFLYISNFLLLELRAPKYGSSTNDTRYLSDDIRSLKNLILTYRSLSLLFNRHNDTHRDYVSVAQNHIVICLSVICNYTIIRHQHSRLLIPIESVLLTGMISVVVTIQLFLTYFKFGAINDLSIQVVRSWERDLVLGRGNKLLMTKYVKSCRPLRFELGNFGCFRKQNSITIVRKLTVYTARFILVTKIFF